MSTAVAEPAVATRKLARSAGRLFEPHGFAGSTLEDIVLGAWEDLRLHGRAECPVCAGELEPSGCDTCGAELS